MAKDTKSIDRLEKKLNLLLKNQEMFAREINGLREEISGLKASGTDSTSNDTIDKSVPGHLPQLNNGTRHSLVSTPHNSKIVSGTSSQKRVDVPLFKAGVERFIGENLTNKIGIAITIIGVAIGVKYAIDRQLINPLMRIILGYIFGLGLLGAAIALRKNFKNFSAVLFSGSMTINYFVTYTAYDFYHLYPQILAFGIMVLITIATVFTAINYNTQVIAHIGLVGAYAVPFLLSEGSGRIVVLFSYITIINVGILFISFKKYWKPLYYSSFVLTWVIYLFWYTTAYETIPYFGLALLFLLIFYTSFYLTFLAYKVPKSEKFNTDDILLLLANSFIFYSVGLSILDHHQTGEHLLGLFTTGNAFINIIVAFLIYRHKRSDRNLYYLISGLALIFITIAIPVQLNGNWVTLLWAGESVILFWIGRTRQVLPYEQLSYPVLLLAFISILHDWTTVYEVTSGVQIIPFFNTNFLTSSICVLSFGFINTLNRDQNYPPPAIKNHFILKAVSFLIPFIFLFTFFYAIRMEIASYWNHKFYDSAIGLATAAGPDHNYIYNYDLLIFKKICILNFALLFLSLLSFVNIIKIKNRQLGLINLGLNGLLTVIFLTAGLYLLSELRESYLQQTISGYYPTGIMYLVIRYISFIFVGVILASSYYYTKQKFIQNQSVLSAVFDCLFHLTLIWVASSELLLWLAMADVLHFSKIGLSLLWGFYSFVLIILGIRKKKKHFRIGAIGLFTITLFKVFFYDLNRLGTISKTVVFISLGLLLLIISFLYNKYKYLIFEE